MKYKSNSLRAIFIARACLRRTRFALAVGQVLTALPLLAVLALPANAQTTSFTFQSNVPAEVVAGTYEMEFKLFDAATGGNQVGTTITMAHVDVAVSFAIQLDF